MQYAPLGHSDFQVSRICLGTMTFGEQNTPEEAFAQLDMALDAGVNFIDTAELYPIPPNARTSGETEAIVGAWLKRRRARDRVILASKVAGPGVAHLSRSSRPFERKALRAALEASLNRLGTDVIDLYQLHWPERKTNYFGRLGYRHADDDDFTPLSEVLDTLGELVKEGLIRAVGVSNETAWGVMSFLRESERAGGPQLVSIQNPYSLLNRSFEVGLAEVAIREQCGLLAYSPLAFGTLSGKYLNGARPARSRLTLFSQYARYSNPRAEAASRAYVELARSHGLDPAQMALAFVMAQPFVTSTIIGATTPEQLRCNLAACDVRLESVVVDGIEAIHTEIPNPAP
ncbi:MAG: NADP(H)-dependent aldo-keto reductase [Hyphomicrobiales bacterium]|nr:NADP(H)-dependent aldo-keto reductase [Hyphomicrobiales bacterium]